MDEALEGVMWFRCPDGECRRCVPCGFIRCPFCGFAFSYIKAKVPPGPRSRSAVVVRERRQVRAGSQRQGIWQRLDELRRRVAEVQGFARRTCGNEGNRGRVSYDIQDAARRDADPSTHSTKTAQIVTQAVVGQGPPAPISQTGVVQMTGPGPQSPAQTSLTPQTQATANAGNRAGTRSQRPPHWATQSNADAPRSQAVLSQPSAPIGNPASARGATSWVKYADARWLVFARLDGPALPQDSRWVSGVRATSLVRHSQRWDSDADYCNDKASLGWARHDSCTVSRLPGQALGAGG